MSVANPDSGNKANAKMVETRWFLSCDDVIADVGSMCGKVNNSRNGDCLLEVIKKRAFHDRTTNFPHKKSLQLYAKGFLYIILGVVGVEPPTQDLVFQGRRLERKFLNEAIGVGFVKQHTCSYVGCETGSEPDPQLHRKRSFLKQYDLICGE